MDIPLEEKTFIVARHIPCDHCCCRGWRSSAQLYESVRPSDDSTLCECGHGVMDHIKNWKDIYPHVQLDSENGKGDKGGSTDEVIPTLHRHILENAQTENSLSNTSPLSVPDTDVLCSKRDRQGTENEAKRQKTDSYDQTKDDGNNPGDTPTKDMQENTALSPSLDTGNALNKESSNPGGLANDGDHTKQLENHAVLDKMDPLTALERRKAEIVTKIVLNDGQPENLIYLTGLKNIFQKQLPMMPKEYITRLVYDRNHLCVALIRRPLKVIGGICYRPFDEQDFAEIVFCAVSSTEQVRGYGAHLMNYLKDHITKNTIMRHFLTYADNSATGYFKKQGFTTDITLDRRKWVGFIKDYEGGTIMQCTVTSNVDYLQEQKQQIGPTSRGMVSGLEIKMDDDMDPLSVPGVREPTSSSETDLSIGTKHPPHYLQMRHLVLELQDHANSWPFRKPVKAEEVTDYYQVIRNPMDLATLEQNVKDDVYATMDGFVTDVQKIFDNCRTYNPEGTIYAKCATILERYFNERMQAWNGTLK